MYIRGYRLICFVYVRPGKDAILCTKRYSLQKRKFSRMRMREMRGKFFASLKHFLMVKTAKTICDDFSVVFVCVLQY